MDEMTGSILIWPLPWAPANWLFCQGQVLPIQQYQALYSLIGTYYGGDGRTTFALPDLRGKVPVGAGPNAQSGTNYTLAQQGGQETVTLLPTQMPAHNHSNGSSPTEFTASLSSVNAKGALGVSAVANSGVSNVPSDTNVPAGIPNIPVSPTASRPVNAYGPADGSTNWPVEVAIPDKTPINGSINDLKLAINGGNMPHPNMQPYLSLNYIICVNGIYPSRP